MIYLILIAVLLALYYLFMSPSSQLFGKFPSRIKTDEKIIYLTFDDGPNEPYTSEIIDYLNSKKIKATFFVVGECANKYPKTIKKIHDSGHSIGNHTKSHKFFNYVKTPAMQKEIQDNQAIIKRITGEEPKLFRPPWLFRNPILLRSIKKFGLKPVSGVFCHSLEVFKIDAQQIAEGAIKKAQPGQIIIFHDGYNSKGANRRQTVEALKLTVEALSKKGYTFKPLN
ncbi:polysaccharide deacetylase family protein [bacterium]|nr:polysaccharide deacetylase family protein [bacterium]